VSNRIESAARNDEQAKARGAARRDVEKGGLTAFLSYFLSLGSVGFGGPIALIGYMQRDLEPVVILTAGLVGVTATSLAR
jgi:hypothetical protein